MSIVEDMVQSIKDQLDDLRRQVNENDTISEKRPQKGKVLRRNLQDERVYIVKNYGRSHALFGPFDRSPLKSFKEDFLSTQKWVSYKKLAYGPGWILLNSGKLTDLKNKFRDEAIEYTEIDRSEFDKKWREYRNIRDSKEDEGSSFEKFTINEWGNRCELSSGFVFFRIGDKDIAVGTQDKKASKVMVGLDSVLRLSQEERELCEEKGWNYLNRETLDRLGDLVDSMKDIENQNVVYCLLKVPIVDLDDSEAEGELDIEVSFPSREDLEDHKNRDFTDIRERLEEFIASGWQGNNKIRGKIEFIKEVFKPEEDHLKV